MATKKWEDARDKRYSSLPKHLVYASTTTGFVESNTPYGKCFEWYTFRNDVWKSTHILFNDNWLLRSKSSDVAQT